MFQRELTNEDRFWLKVLRTPTCWLWTGNTNERGYPGFWDGTRRVYAHRWSYEHFVGPIPPRLQIDHLCRVKLCIRPEHLQPVTNRENHRRGLKAQQTHCIHGHKFTPENTKLKTNGTRSCRACNRERSRKSHGYKGLPRPTHCIRGHRFTSSNTYIRKNGTRQCRACRNLYPSRIRRPNLPIL